MNQATIAIHTSVLQRLLSRLMLMLVALFTLASCSEEDDTEEEFANWQEKNQTEWNNIYSQATQRIAAGDTSWKIIRSYNLPDTVHGPNTDYIVVHVENEGTGSGCPLYTDTVRVHYKGRLLPSTSYTTGYQFDSSWGAATSAESAKPYEGAVSSFVEGFTTALQYMHIGDNWTVYIPWTLGYGETATSSIPAYSVMIFDLQLDSYFRAGQTVPDFKAKEQQLAADE